MSSFRAQRGRDERVRAEIARDKERKDRRYAEMMRDFKPSFDHMGEEYAAFWSDEKKRELAREQKTEYVPRAIPNPWS